MSETPSNQAREPWRLDTIILTLGGEDPSGVLRAIDIPVTIAAVAHGVRDFGLIRITPVWGRIADDDLTASDPHTGEVRSITRGTRITYSDIPLMVDCEMPDELVRDLNVGRP